MIYTMNPIALVFFVLVIVAGIVTLGIEVFKGTRSVVSFSFWGSILVLGLVDLYFVVFGGVGSSLSAWIVSHGLGDLGFWKFSIGCVCGHLFFPMIQQKVTAYMARAAVKQT